MLSCDNQVRVFNASTFRDMHVEREHPVSVVFSELRERGARMVRSFRQ